MVTTKQFRRESEATGEEKRCPDREAKYAHSHVSCRGSEEEHDAAILEGLAQALHRVPGELGELVEEQRAQVGRRLRMSP